MLEIKVPYVKQDAVTLKLSSGEEIIATFESETQDQFVVSKAVVLVQVQSAQGVGMMPWMMSADAGNIMISKHNIMVVCKTQADVAKTYLENTTGIQLQ